MGKLKIIFLPLNILNTQITMILLLRSTMAFRLHITRIWEDLSLSIILKMRFCWVHNFALQTLTAAELISL